MKPGTRWIPGSVRRPHVRRSRRWIGYAKEVGFGEVLRRGTAAAEELPTDIVYAGFSLGVMPAQSLAQTRPGARGRILYSAAFPASEFKGPWPEGLPLEIHMMDSDPWGEEDRPAAEALVAEAGGAAELFLYRARATCSPTRV